MRIAVAADHAGFALKQQLANRLRLAGHQVSDLGTFDQSSCDYPDFASAAAQQVASGSADRGILVCTTGMGMVMAANKVDGVRAALATTPEVVRLTRAHNDANVLAIGAGFTTPENASAMVDEFLRTPFDGGERHTRRVAKIAALDEARREEQVSR